MWSGSSPEMLLTFDSEFFISQTNFTNIGECWFSLVPAIFNDDWINSYIVPKIHWSLFYNTLTKLPTVHDWKFAHVYLPMYIFSKKYFYNHPISVTSFVKEIHFTSCRSWIKFHECHCCGTNYRRGARPFRALGEIVHFVPSYFMEYAILEVFL